MGAACAPSYANLFLGFWERHIFQGDGAHATDPVVGWFRYIDDVLMIWNGGETSLSKFMQELNHNTFNLKFTYSWHKTKIDFLDITVCVAEDGSIETDLFRKETSVNSLLHASSAHIYSVIKAIPVGQFLRNRRVCSTEARFERQSAILSERFRARGYSRRSIRAGYGRAKSTRRGDLLRQGTKSRMDDGSGVRFISTSNCQWNRIREILNRHWSVLQTDAILASHLTKFPLMTQRRGKNLKDNLVRSHYVAKNKTSNFLDAGSPRVGCYPCGSCVACPNILRCGTFRTSDGSREFKIRDFISCNTSFVIYYATCPCSLIYVGLTSRELKIRTREHVRDILAAGEVVDVSGLKTLPRHFRMHHGSDPRGLKIRGIERIRGGIRGGNMAKILAQRECRWIVTLDTLAPKGLNEKLSFAPFL
ncbi:unnamed protein product [Ranitomeya imitator]|uniref:Helix-turn-helix domain-containing protein n=1 Tax=Ranitomeya imitator TaxID=111125 RepID=A0ABN9MB07_9NEOB|nr:unnamed protein product [Ranitomeya imitator]